MAESGTRLVQPDLPSPRNGNGRFALTRTRANRLLALGGLAGLALALSGLVRLDPATGRLPAGVVARVNDDFIPLQEFERTLAALAQDRRSSLTSEDRRFALDRLIDETLLLQRALELDLPRTDSRVRHLLVRAVLESVAASADEIHPSESELRKFYEEEKTLFQGPPRIRVRHIWIRAETQEESAEAEQRAQIAYQRLKNGDDFSAVQRDLGDREIAPIPDTLLPTNKLADYLGPTPLRTVLELPVGEFSPPVRSTRGYHVLQVVERKQEPPPPLEEIRPQVLAEFRRRASERALRRYLDDLRSRATIVIDSKVLRTP